MTGVHCPRMATHNCFNFSEKPQLPKCDAVDCPGKTRPLAEQIGLLSIDKRHTSEDLHYLRERGFAQTADEIERLHRVEDTLMCLKDKLYTRLDNYLVEMKSDCDDSITGFTEAWEVMTKFFDEVQK